ncbi:hypothetical protein ABZT49_03830 [Methylobacterium sp. EM32]|uniref:hypothetical protein n=1 Tax=Methylobacterium sp. EM32 TaxID=3163481 RepID=UPI0033B0B42C
MPYGSEPSSATGAFDVLKDPTVIAFMRGVEVSPNLSGVEDKVRAKVVDVTNLVTDLPEGTIYASDASPYEAVAKKDLPSVRVGLIKFANVLISIPEYKRIRDRNDIFVDPVDIANLKKASNALSVALPGAGISSKAIPKTKALFRAKVFEIFHNDSFKCGSQTLFNTFIDLLKRSGSVVAEGGRDGIVLQKGKKSPIDGSALVDRLFIPLSPGYVDIATLDKSTERVYVTDALRVQDVFAEEGSNTECFNRLMSAMEHILVAHVIRCSHMTDRSITGQMHVIVDGPLAIFGEAARFHRSIMSLLHDIRMECRESGLPGPLVIGVSKSGKIVEHASLISFVLQFDDANERRRGTFVIPIDDDYRYSMIEPSHSSQPDNFGGDTYYGQSFIVRSSHGKIFDVTLAYPFKQKAEIDGVPFKYAKVDLNHYGADLGRMVSLIEMMQTDLFSNALIPVHLAHRYASIAHSPGGRSLDSFVREALKLTRER